MHADSYFRIGKTHRVCEDYARTTKDPALGFVAAFVSDGCSASPDTDVGSRAIVLSAAEKLNAANRYIDPEWIARDAQMNEQFGLEPECIDATLMALFPLEEPVIRAVVIGDGVVAARRRDGTLEWWNVQFVPNGTPPRSAPGYASYTQDLDRCSFYIERGYAVRQVTHTSPEGVVIGEPEQLRVVAVSDPALPGYCASTFEGWTWEHDFPVADYDFVAVLSDGVETFYTKNDRGAVTPIPLATVLEHVMAIKGAKGQFVNRRCQRFFEHCAKIGWQHADDFSMAAIWCREDK